MIVHLGAFLALSALVILVPGPDTAVVTRNALLGGLRSGLATGVGTVSGLLVWTVAAATGLAALLRASEPAFVAVKVAGCAYLAYLGLRALAAALGRGDANTRAISRSSSPRPAAALRQGLLTNLGNPKIAVFFTSFLPQFVPDRSGHALASLLLLGAIFAALGIAWLAGYVVLIVRVGDVLRGPRVRRVLDGLTGVALLAASVRIAAERR